MAPRKKTPTMKWVVKSQQPAKTAEPATEKKKTSSVIMPDSSLLPDCLSPSPSAKKAQPATKEQTILSTSDWSLQREDLLHIISLKVEDRIDAIHARSVCSSWRSVFPFPSCLLSTSYSLPSFSNFPRKGRGLCTLEKCPMFLFRVRSPSAANALPCEVFLGGIRRDESEEELPSSPLQCSVKVKIKESDPTLMNMLDCHIFPLGHHYRIIGWGPGNWRTGYRGVAFLALNKDGRGGGGGEFAVLICYSHDLLVLRSSEMKWRQLEKLSAASCKDLLSFRGRFYAVFRNGDTFVIDPYSLEATPLSLSECPTKYLVPSGNDELFLVEKFVISVPGRLISHACRVRRLDGEAGKWVVATELGDRVLFINEHLENVCCSAKDLPDGCGVTGNSIVFTDVGIVTYSFKYGLHTGREENDRNYWSFSTENRVTILNTSPVVALRVECASP